MRLIIKNLAILASIVAISACTQNNEPVMKESNEVIDAIMSRRSVRHYTDKAVCRDTLKLLAECGINAPNAMNRQDWAIRIVDSPEYLDGVTDLMKAGMPFFVKDDDPKFRNGFRNATAVIFVASPVDENGMIDISTGALCENICLAAQSMGLGTVIMGGPIVFLNSAPEAKPYLDRLSIPEGYVLRVCVGVGYPDEAPDAKPRDTGKVSFVD